MTPCICDVTALKAFILILLNKGQRSDLDIQGTANTVTKLYIQ